jgi:tetratricopeptide (TPR) repeat protein
VTTDELIAERDFLLKSLTDLEAERAAGDIDEHDYLALKDDYTARAGEILREIDQRQDDQTPAAAAVVVAAPHAGARRARRQASRWRPLAWASGIVAFAVIAGLLVERGAGQRVAGQTATGNTPASVAGNAAALAASADLQQASADLGKGDYLGALRLYDKIVRNDPTNAPALAYRGWVLVLSGRAAKDTKLQDGGLISLRAAEKADPSFPDAHFFIGNVLLEDKGDASGAAAEFRKALSLNLAAPFAAEVNRELKVALGQGTSATPTTTLGP